MPWYVTQKRRGQAIERHTAYSNVLNDICSCTYVPYVATRSYRAAAEAVMSLSRVCVRSGLLTARTWPRYAAPGKEVYKQIVGVYVYKQTEGVYK